MAHNRNIGLIIVLIMIMALLLPAFMTYGAGSSQEGTTHDNPERFGTVEYFSTFTAGSTLTDSFYYSDDWFLQEPKIRNDALALVSMQLVASTVEENGFETGITFLRKLGFEQSGVSGFDDPDPEGCCYLWGIKTIGTGSSAFTLVAVAIQSHSQDQRMKQIGWRQNFLVNSDQKTAEHASYALAADKAASEILSLTGDENVKYWITGQSRGGAIAGLLATRLADAADSVYAYTFESPANVEISAVPDNENEYGYIHNYLCSEDIVTMIPPWGMTRCGTEHLMSTAEITEKIAEELEKMGSDALDTAQSYDPESTGEIAVGLIQALNGRIPSREDYSALHTDVFPDASGKEIRISYVYQDLLIRLMNIVFGNVLEGVDTENLLSGIDELAPAVSSLYKAVKEESDSDYYEASVALQAFLEKQGIDLKLTEEDLYVLLKLVGPVFAGTDFVPESEEFSTEDLLTYLTPLIELVAGKDSLFFSHHFDTLIARLKVLAPEPAMEDLHINMAAPKAGDDVKQYTKAAEDAFEEPGYSWLTASAEWNTRDETFREDKVYYLSITLSCTGHSVPEDMKVTINGKEPEEPLECTYKDGITDITGIWKFETGTPQMVGVSFDTAGHGDAPELVYVQAGTKLEYALDAAFPETVSDSEGLWKFNGWFDDGGLFCEDVYAEEDLTLHASWTRLIDKVEISYVIPHTGEEPGEPAVSEDALYHISDFYFRNEDWDTVTMIENTDPLTLMIEIYPDAQDVEFLSEPDADLGEVYTGVLILNGEELETYYRWEDKCICAEYTFIPLGQ